MYVSKERHTSNSHMLPWRAQGFSFLLIKVPSHFKVQQFNLLYSTAFNGLTSGYFHIYRIIRKSLRDFRPLRYSIQDCPAEGEHVNRGRDLTGARYVHTRATCVAGT